MPPKHILPTPATPRTAETPGPGDHLASHPIDVWSVRLSTPVPPTAMAVLDRDEQARAGRFRFPIDRDRYVARHAFLRQVLAGYLDTTPPEVRIRRTRLGRPELAASRGIDFSTSHSDGVAIVAVNRWGRIGVDIERIRPLDDALDLAETYMTAREVAWLRTVPIESRSSAFLDLWTRKEAAVKAIGVGLSMPLDRFDTGAPGPDGVSIASGPPGDRALHLVGIAGLAGFVAAVALEGRRPSVHHMIHTEVAA